MTLMCITQHPLTASKRNTDCHILIFRDMQFEIVRMNSSLNHGSLNAFGERHNLYVVRDIICFQVFRIQIEIQKDEIDFIDHVVEF